MSDATLKDSYNHATLIVGGNYEQAGHWADKLAILEEPKRLRLGTTRRPPNIRGRRGSETTVYLVGRGPFRNLAEVDAWRKWRYHAETIGATIYHETDIQRRLDERTKNR